MKTEIPVLYTDRYLMVVNKPAGIVVEEDERGNETVIGNIKATLPNGLRGNNILQPVHRIDRSVSGVLLIACKQSVLKLLNLALAERKITKTYLALVETKPPKDSDTLKHWLAKDDTAMKAIVKDQKFQLSSEAILEYQIREKLQGKYLLEINLLTGKYHQIRAQLAHIGCPVVGDLKYGSKTPLKNQTIALHAWRIGFKHPIDGDYKVVEAAMPVF